MGADADAILALDAVELRDRMAAGALRAVELVEACIGRIAAREPEVRAWAWFDPDFARAQAQALDAHRATGRPIGPLHGLPVGLKDIIDTARIPTENGARRDAGRRPARDAWIVDRLKAAGAVIMGKTVTTELAFLTPSVTRNPRNPEHTPGGSSAGSAAAVAAGMVPLAIGTQTGGSVLRPASFCGVTGFKPSFGAIPRTGVLMQSHSLDTLGVFAASPSGAALLADALFGHDPADPATSPAPPPRLLATARTEPPVAPVFACVRLPRWDDADPQMRAAFDALKAELGDRVFETGLPPAFDEAAALRARINFAEMARCYRDYRRDGFDLLGPETRKAILDGEAVLARDYLAALDCKAVLNAGLDAIFDRCDALLCPAALGPAPKDLGSTGDAIFNGLFTFTGNPAIAIPAFASAEGLPMGLQIVGRRGEDALLLRTARWLADRLGC